MDKINSGCSHIRDDEVERLVKIAHKTKIFMLQHA